MSGIIKCPKCGAYTSLEQSKKLGEFLPEESSDACYWKNGDRIILCPYDNFYKKGQELEMDVTPCWSLGALIKVMPKIYKEDECYIPLVGKYYEGSDKYICGYFGDGLLQWNIADNPIDAVFEMIIWLKENNKL